MTIKSLPQLFFRRFTPLCAVAISMTVGFATPVFADTLTDIQRLIKQGQHPQALEKVDAYLSGRPKDAQGRFLKGVLYTEMNKPNEAIAIFTKLSEDYPELPEPYNNLAVLYAQQQQYDKARGALEMAIRTHPSYTIAYENLGDVYAKLASQAYDKALQLGSPNTVTQNKLALIHELISVPGKGNVKPAIPAPTLAANATNATQTPAKAAEPKTTEKTAESKPAADLAAPPDFPVPAEPELTPATEPATPKNTVAVAPAAPPVVQAPAPRDAAPSAHITAKAAPASDEEVKNALHAWAKAWEHKDMKAYFGAYAGDYRPPKGMSRKDWEAERTARITGKSGQISVQIEGLQATVEGDTATARFRQHYKAPGLRSSTMKTMTLVRSGNRWLIKEESTH